MSTTRFLSLAFLTAGTALGLTGCIIEPTPEPEPEPLSFATSFEAMAKLAVERDYDLYELPDTEYVLLRLDDAPDGGVNAVLASDFDSTSAAFARAGTGLSLRQSISLNIPPPGPGIFEAELIFESMELVPTDADGDGKADAVEGSGSGIYTFIGGDVQYDQPFTVEIGGSLDRTPPDLFVAATDRLHVLDGLTLIASEPLRAGIEVQARVGSTTIDLSSHPLGEYYATSFETRAILPFDSEIVVTMDPAPKDLAGFDVEFGLERILTMSDPGMFAEDGFEGELAAVASGVEVVNGIGTLPAIGGTRSLLIEESSRLTMRVPLQEGDTHLRFEARQLSEYGDGYFCVNSVVRVGFPALDMIATVYPAWPYDVPESTGDERWAGASGVSTVELALPENAGDEVVFDIYPQPPQPGHGCPEGAMLIDDLRAE